MNNSAWPILHEKQHRTSTSLTCMYACTWNQSRETGLKNRATRMAAGINTP